MIGTALIALVAFLVAYVILLSMLIDYGSRGCFCDVTLRNGDQSRIMNVEVDDVLLLMHAINTGETIEFISVGGPHANVKCFLVKLIFKDLTKDFFERKRSFMNAAGDNWRVGLLSYLLK